VRLQWQGGDFNRSTQVTINCVSNAGEGTFSPDPPNGEPEHPALHYNFVWNSNASWACPSPVATVSLKGGK